MASKDQTEGFEKEKKFNEVLWEAVGECPSLKAKTVRKIIAQINPEFMEGLFSRRPCVRKLRYIGPCGNESDTCPNEVESKDEFFKKGEIYESIDFTGGTYSIVGYGDRRIGYAHFEWVDDEADGEDQGEKA